MKQTDNTRSLRTLLALSMAFALLAGALSGCGGTTTPPQPEASSPAASAAQSETESSASAAQPEAESSGAVEETSASAPAADAAAGEPLALERQDPDAETAALLDGEDHEFEQEIAYRYYHDGESQKELSGSERNETMSYGVWDFDAKGNGVFAVTVDRSMSQSWNYIEYTSDYGETWQSAGVYDLITSIDDVKVAGNTVVFSVSNGVTESRHSLVYSLDLCQSFWERDTIDFAPSALTDALQSDPSSLGMDLLGIDEADGSVVLGWYRDKSVNVSEFEDFNTAAQSKRNYFLIGKTDAGFTQLQVLCSSESK